MANLQVLRSQEDGFTSLSQRKSFDGVRGPVNSEKEVGKTA